MKILVADDSNTVRKIMANVLTNMGHEVILAEDGNTALAIMERPDSPHMLISDWQMPGLNGLELSTRIRSMEKPVPPYIIILTANHEPEKTVACLDAGANDYLTKPFKSDELKARIGAGCRTTDLCIKLYRAQQAMVQLAVRDPLTGLYNRCEAMEALKRETAVAKRYKTTVSVALVDIDNFNAVNKEHSQQDGDVVLREFAQTVLGCINEYDVLARYCDDRLMLLSAHMTTIEDMQVFEHIRETVASHRFTVASGDVLLTVSIGEAHANDGMPPEELLKKAEEALATAKNNGRNRVVHI